MCACVCHCGHVKVKSSTRGAVGFLLVQFVSGDQTQAFSRCFSLLSHLLVLVGHLRHCCLWLRIPVYPVQKFIVRWAWPSLASIAATAAEGSAWLCPCVPDPDTLFSFIRLAVEFHPFCFDLG